MTTQQMLDERYGARRSGRSRRITWIVVGVLATLAAAAVAWMTWASAANAVTADETGFEVVDAHQVTLTFQVTAPVGRAIACALEAQDIEHGVVGWRVVEYPASDVQLQAFTEAVPTVTAATTVLVNACWVL